MLNKFLILFFGSLAVALAYEAGKQGERVRRTEFELSIWRDAVVEEGDGGDDDERFIRAMEGGD